MSPTTRTASRALVALLAGAALLTGCSEPEPGPAPGPATSPTSSSSPPTSSSATAPAASASGAPRPSTTSSASATTQTPSGGRGGTEPSRAVETAAPRALDDPARSDGAEVSLTSVRATTIKASSPLDRSGPGVLVRLKVRNTSQKALDTSFVQVAATSAGGDPGTVLTGAPTDQLVATVPAGSSAEGTYAFLLGNATSGAVTVLVYVTSGQPVLQFRGRVR